MWTTKFDTIFTNNVFSDIFQVMKRVGEDNDNSVESSKKSRLESSLIEREDNTLIAHQAVIFAVLSYR